MMVMLSIGLMSCIGSDIIDDRVPAQLRITNPIDSLKVGDQHQIDFLFTDIIGRTIDGKEVNYFSSDDAIATVSTTGILEGIAAGDVTITVEADSGDGLLTADFQVNIGEVTAVVDEITERTGTARTTTFYVLEGDFRLFEDETTGNLKLAIGDNWVADDNLPGLYVYLTNNPNSIANALEISEVTQFSGAHEFDVPAGTGINDYSHVLYFCKPFVVKVGDGPFDN